MGPHFPNRKDFLVATTKTVTVLIAARDEEPHIERTLSSIRSQSRAPDCVIVVNDGSRDRTARFAQRCGAKVLTLSMPSGKKSKAQNAALPIIETDLIVTVDADTVLEQRALERLVAPFQGDNPPTGSYGYVVSREPRSVFQRGRDIEIRVQQFFQKRAQDLWNIPLVAPGCLAAWQTEAVRRREEGFVSHSLAEDMDLTWEILTQRDRFADIGGGRILFVRDALAYTLDPRTFRLYLGQTNRWFAAFFQNLKTHWRAILCCKRPLLSLFILWYLLDGLGGFILFFTLPLLSLAMQWSWDLRLFGWTLLGFFVVRTAFAGTVSVLEGFRLARITAGKTGAIRRTVNLLLSPKQTLLSLPCYLFVTDLLNRFLWPWAFVREVLLGRWFSLTFWKKGH